MRGTGVVLQVKPHTSIFRGLHHLRQVPHTCEELQPLKLLQEAIVKIGHVVYEVQLYEISIYLMVCTNNVDIDKYQHTMLIWTAYVTREVGSHHSASSISKLQIKSMMHRANSCKTWQVIYWLIHRFGFHSKVCGLRTTSLMILHSSKRPCLHLPLMTFRLDSRPYCTDKTWPWERAACAAATSKGPLEAWLGWLVHARKWRKAHSKGFLTTVQELLLMDMVNRMHGLCDCWIPMRQGLNLQEPTISSK